MVTTMTATEARAALPELLDRVLEGEEITITRHGKPVAVMLRPDSLRSRRADRMFKGAAEIEAMMEEVRGLSLEELGPGLTPEYAEELIAEIRAGRDSRG